MGYAERLWYAMHDVSAAAAQEKHPGQLGELAEIADRSRIAWSQEGLSVLARTMLPLTPQTIEEEWFPQTTEALRSLYKLLEETVDPEPPAKRPKWISSANQ